MLPSDRAIVFRTFRPGDEAAFHQLNAAWIEQLFVLEEVDRIVLDDPYTHVLARGGQICMAELPARDGALPIGCCALVRIGPGEYELAKMAVSEAVRGHGIGRRLLRFAIDIARQMGAHRLCLESNTKNEAAIHLYEELGFRHLPAPPHPSKYARANVFMELLLAQPEA